MRSAAVELALHLRCPYVVMERPLPSRAHEKISLVNLTPVAGVRRRNGRHELTSTLLTGEEVRELALKQARQRF